MVDYSKVLEKYYEDAGFSVIDNSYNTIHFEFEYVPTQEHLDALWSVIEIDEMRETRNQLLKDCDYTALPDYPNRELW